MIKTVEWFSKFYCNTPAAAAAVVAFAIFVWHARFVSSSLILCSIRKCAVFIACGAPVIVTIRFRVPGANVPFFDIWILAPDICWISTRLLPPGPLQVFIARNFGFCSEKYFFYWMFFFRAGYDKNVVGW